MQLTIKRRDFSHYMTTSIRFFSSDLDGTLLGDDDARERFKSIWEAQPEGHRPRLCYNTGRMLDDVLSLIQRQILPKPDYIISGVGTNIYSFHEARVMKAFSEILEEGWNIDQVEGILKNTSYPLQRQPAHFQNAYKSSWFFDDALPEEIADIENRLEEAELSTHVVYSSGRHLDIVSRWANKGNALKWLLNFLKVGVAETAVAGDSGNDSAMFLLKGINGIVTGNAQPELVEVTRHLPFYHAPSQEICATAVIHGLHHYGILSDKALDELPKSEKELLYETLRYGSDENFAGISKEQLDFIRTGYHKAIEALKKTITPLGFAACSLEDNDSVGTDANYRSVWARDGAITVIGSLPLLNQDDDIHQCQRQTLLTLLSHLAPNGQLPINVRIDDHLPEYAGVGGIAAVDSGLWVVMAFYAYASKTRDLDFVRAHMGKLERVMAWLSAHDSNNDSLLEIPEAGDWTDLFGRSYNVLYDEVLWYQANVSFGRLLQMLGNEQRAGDYMRWARVIKREILSHFWPSTQRHSYQAAVTFADQQYSLGDARYLIAQVTPFDFSWRCDTFANVLAFLLGVTDDKKAGQTFRFMWGVGVNEPYPISNLYPVVHEGDKDWRDYYTVNLLNLPDHYHNGGIWPFVGGHWVRFINKLGLRDVALQELYRLAELNKLGVLNEWEFNEWVHGRTGRPMGKAYQAWSASEFIRACHELHIIA